MSNCLTTLVIGWCTSVDSSRSVGAYIGDSFLTRVQNPADLCFVFLRGYWRFLISVKKNRQGLYILYNTKYKRSSNFEFLRCEGSLNFSTPPEIAKLSVAREAETIYTPQKFKFWIPFLFSVIKNL